MNYQATEIYPDSGQRGLLFSGHHYAGEYAELSLDAFYTERQSELTMAVSPTTGHFYRTESTIWGASPSVSFTLAGDWRLRLQGMAGRNDREEGGRRNLDIITGVGSAHGRKRYEKGRGWGGGRV